VTRAVIVTLSQMVCGAVLTLVLMAGCAGVGMVLERLL
jgi:hypothetical protein